MRKFKLMWGNYWYETDRLKPKLKKEKVFNASALILFTLLILITFLK